MSQEENKVEPAAKTDRERQPDRKTWVTPTVSESPVNDLTSAAFTGIGADGGFYS